MHAAYLTNAPPYAKTLTTLLGLNGRTAQQHMSKVKAKAVQSVIRLVIKAGQAKPAPPVGPALGQAGLNLMSFCKDFNAKTADIKEDVPVPVSITAYTDKTFTYELKTPPTSYFIKKALDLKGGSQKPGHQAAGQLSLKHVLEIATVKQRDAPELTLEALCKSVVGTARSMGVSIQPYSPGGSEAVASSAATDAVPAAA